VSHTEQHILGPGIQKRCRDAGGADIADKVSVQVDESRQHCVGRPVDHARIAVDARCVGTDGSNPAVLDADRPVCEIATLLDIEQPAGAYDHRLGRGWQRGHQQRGEKWPGGGDAPCIHVETPAWPRCGPAPPDPTGIGS
jgi:hypothetical protein